MALPETNGWSEAVPALPSRTCPSIPGLPRASGASGILSENRPRRQTGVSGCRQDDVDFAGAVDAGDQAQLDVASLARPGDEGQPRGEVLRVAPERRE